MGQSDMGPESPLPLPSEFSDAASYIESLLNFCTTSQLLQTLCGGVHILDFLTRSPELYNVILPASWRSWFQTVEVNDVLDLLMREDLSILDKTESNGGSHCDQWRGYEFPPQTLIDYVKAVRGHLLCRDFKAAKTDARQSPKKHVFMGMNPKKVHEVGHFAHYVDKLVADIERSNTGHVTHLADFGAGQNYLGRVLASNPYNRNIIAIESRSHVVAGAKSLDVHAKVTKKVPVVRNKKEYRAALATRSTGTTPPSLNNEKPTQVSDEVGKGSNGDLAVLTQLEDHPSVDEQAQSDLSQGQRVQLDIRNDHTKAIFQELREVPRTGTGTLQYVEHRIKDGDLMPVIKNITPIATNSSHDTVGTQVRASLIVMSLHSCGNLVHHGLRTLTLNPSVKGVAMVGCCYNLMTERLGPPTHKLNLRPQHPRLDATASAHDPQGFPMSERFATYKHTALPTTDFSDGASQLQEVTGLSDDEETGIRLNITARMMAVQAPQNWTQEESTSFFTRHFFRALLQRIFLDKGVVGAPSAQINTKNMCCSPAGSSWGLANGDGAGTVPIIIGNLKKKCYESFVSYVRGAVEKVAANGGNIGKLVQDEIGSMSDDEILTYETQYQERKKELSIVWSLMAFSAGVVEAMVVVDRWLWLMEQPCVAHAWVEPVFDYAVSPRNLVVVGIKK